MAIAGALLGAARDRRQMPDWYRCRCPFGIAGIVIEARILPRRARRPRGTPFEVTFTVLRSARNRDGDRGLYDHASQLSQSSAPSSVAASTIDPRRRATRGDAAPASTPQLPQRPRRSLSTRGGTCRYHLADQDRQRPAMSEPKNAMMCAFGAHYDSNRWSWWTKGRRHLLGQEERKWAVATRFSAGQKESRGRRLSALGLEARSDHRQRHQRHDGGLDATAPTSARRLLPSKRIRVKGERRLTSLRRGRPI